METSQQLSIAQSISRKYAFEHGLHANDVLGAAWESVEKAQATWDASKGKGLKGWAYMQLMGIMAKEGYQPKQYGAKAQFSRLDDEGYSEDGDGMALHEKISQHRDAGATEDSFIQAIRVGEAQKILDAMSPRLQSIIRAEIEGVEFENGTAELDNRVYTAARASQLKADLPERIADARKNPLGLVCDAMPGNVKKAGLFEMPEQRRARAGQSKVPTETMSLFGMGGAA